MAAVVGRHCVQGASLARFKELDLDTFQANFSLILNPVAIGVKDDEIADTGLAWRRGRSGRGNRSGGWHQCWRSGG